ncbi:MAG TPA: type II secretion system protein GspM [Kofleriaceae bacterium]|jgi:type II secretory pathway component PulM
MSSITDRARDFWDRISPRERRMVVVAAVATPIVLAIWLSFAIHDGLDSMAVRNEHTRKALAALSDLRARGQTHAQVDDAVAMMGTEPLSLDTYLNNAAKKAHFDLKSVITPHTPQPRNGFVTNSSSLTLDKLSINELKDFMQEVETGSKVVAVTRLELRRDFHDKDKISATLEVSTYSKEPPAKGDGSGSSSGGSGSGTGG